MRGRFLRGVDDGAGNDPDAGTRIASATGGNAGDAVGTLQVDELKQHNHSAVCDTAGTHTHPFMSYNDNYSHSGANTQTNNKDTGKGTYNSTNQVKPAGYHTHVIHIGNTGGNETRPVNAAVYYIIKY